ncbi:MAG: class I SAM-dependent methyltransferase [Planctomycetes bacterium]|nr:class I SAM-dependent methyltransferase [Planctomycetota bacterium]
MPTCNVCNGTDAAICIEGAGTWHCYEPSLGKPFPYRVALCRRCGHVFGDWDHDHTQQYVDEEYTTCETSLPIYDAYTTFCLQAMPRTKQRPARVLEIGFNRGALLQHFYDFGFECHGVEPGRKNVEFAQRRMPKARLDQGFFSPEWIQQYPEGHFDLVILTSVFEHMTEPMAVLRAIRPALSEHGRLFLLVPDLAQYTPAYQVKPADRDRYGCAPLVFFYRNFFLCYAQHVNHFSPASLKRYLSVAGLEVCQMANISGLWYLAAPGDAAPSQMDFPDLVQYHHGLMAYYQRLLHDMQTAMRNKLRGKRVVCYGAGRDFGYFLDVFRPQGIEPLAVADDTAPAGTIHGVTCVPPQKLALFRPDVCLASSFDYEDQIAAKAAKALPAATEILTLTQLIYELDIAPPNFTDFAIRPCGARALRRAEDRNALSG